MKPCKLFSFLFAVIAALAMVGSATAQTNAYDDAIPYTRNLWFTNRLSFGFGFTPWVLTNGGTAGKSGFTIVNGGVIGSGATQTNGTGVVNDAFAIFANNGAFNAFGIAFRGFSNSLAVGNVYKVQWSPQGIGNAGTAGGYTLRNGNDTTSTNWVSDPNMRFAFYYAGGASNSFSIFDGNGFNYIGIPFGSGGGSSAIGLECDFTLQSADTYHLEIRQLSSGTLLYLADNQPLGGTTGSTIDSTSWIDFNTTGNMVYNHMQIVSGSTIPPTIVNVQPTNGSIFADPTATNVSFEVDSLGSTLTSNGITLRLNGVLQTNLTLATNGAGAQLLATNNVPLAPNTFYNVTIIAVDSNGNRATNNSTFNTFLATDVYVDAADYNFGAGQFLNVEPQDSYANLLGTNGVDYFEADLSGTNNVYRPGDLPQVLTLATDATGDPVDHANERLNGGTVYNLGFTDNGDWDNYTRALPVATNYSIYARAASGSGAQFEMELLVNPLATNSTQPLVAVGDVTIPNTGGSRIFSGQLTPLADAFGNTVVLPLSGTTTFRQTSLQTRTYNLEYFVFVPVTNAASTLRPYLSTANPAPAAAGVTLDNPILFSIANRQTGLNPATLQVSLNGTNITGAGTLATNTLGAAFSYSPPNFLPSNTTNTVQVVFTDSGSVSSTNTWQFVTINLTNTLVPTSFAQPINSGTTNGYGITMFKIADSAPVVGTLSNAWNELHGLIIDTNSGTPYINLATNASGSDFYLETNEIAYDITGAVTGSFTFTNRTNFPYIPVGPASNFVMQALTYLQLTNGAYHLAVRSDDGFELTMGPTPANTNLVLGLFDLGRANTTQSDIYFTIQTNGLYPTSLFYVQEGSGGNVEFFSYKNGKAILVNDPTNPNAIKAFEALVSSANPVTILSPAYNGGTASFSFLTQSGRTHFVESTGNLAGTNTVWSPLQTVTGTGSTTNITDNTGGTRHYYRVRTQ